ncbi:universal stress protein [Rugamonas sp. A1-17]|nr:universal stress protein [Rugamonas sp. A1-17]
MCYKTILVQADAADSTPSCATIAAQIAIADQAHLVGVSMSGMDQMIYQCNTAAPGVVVLPADLRMLTTRADASLAAFAKRVEHLGVGSFETRRIDGLPDIDLLMHARYADLLVLRQPGAPEQTPYMPDSALQYIVLHCGQPVLVVPYAGGAAGTGRHPLLAWNGSPEAARAIHAALPLLKRARQVTLAVFNGEETWGAHGELPGADMATFLARHGIQVEVVQRQTKGPVGEALLSLASDIQADLLVMGCYGHSRLREIILGGATRDIMRGMTLPVLMAH